MSVIRLLKDQNCTTTCFPTHRELQERSSGKMIGIAKEYNVLYYFTGSPSKSHHQEHHSLSITSNSNVLLGYQWLEPSSFDYLRRLYPKQFINKEHSAIQYGSCVLAKQTRKNYPNHTYQPSQPFRMIHSAIWSRTPQYQWIPMVYNLDIWSYSWLLGVPI